MARPVNPDAPVVIAVRVRPHVKAAWAAAAKRKGKPLATFLADKLSTHPIVTDPRPRD